jgi:hypothetical protein
VVEDSLRRYAVINYDRSVLAGADGCRVSNCVLWWCACGGACGDSTAPPSDMRKKVDGRVRTLIENGVKTGHRSMFVIVGDRGKEAVVNLHYILSKSRVRSNPSVLWCFKKELGFATYVAARCSAVCFE